MFSKINENVGDLIDALDNPNFDIDKSIDKILERNGVGPTYTFKTTEDVDNYVAALKKFVLPLMPRDFWFGKPNKKTKKYGTEFTPGIRSKSSWYNLYNEYYKPQMELLRNLPDSAFGASIDGVTDFKRSGYSTIFKKP